MEFEDEESRKPGDPSRKDGKIPLHPGLPLQSDREHPGKEEGENAEQQVLERADGVEESVVVADDTAPVPCMGVGQERQQSAADQPGEERGGEEALEILQGRLAVGCPGFTLNLWLPIATFTLPEFTCGQ